MGSYKCLRKGNWEEPDQRGACPHCRRRYTTKDSGSTPVSTVFGRVEVPNPRWNRCGCQTEGPQTFRPTRTWLNGQTSPEMLYLETKWIACRAATGSFQLFATQTLPAGSIDTSVSIWILPLLKTWMTSPVLVSAGCRERQKVGGQAALRSCSCVCGCGLNLGYQPRNMEFGLGHFVALGYARNW
jgi:hypothetical protein